MLNCHRGGKRKAREEFLLQKKSFNAEVQRAKRVYWKKRQADIEEWDSTDKKLFWKEIGKIGISQERRKEIPMEVKLPDGEISRNIDDVLNVWKKRIRRATKCFHG